MTQDRIEALQGLTKEMDALALQLKTGRYMNPVEYRRIQVELRAKQLQRYQLEAEPVPEEPSHD